jgi:hypothetical protein
MQPRTVTVKVQIGEHQVCICGVCDVQVIPEVLEASKYGPSGFVDGPAMQARSWRPPASWEELRGPGVAGGGVRLCGDCAQLVAAELQGLIDRLRERVSQAPQRPRV